MKCNPFAYHYPSRRNVIYAKNGMTCSTSPIASDVGLSVLKEGGNAVDAALAMAMTLPLVEPGSNDLGSDCFVMVWSEKEHKLFGLNGSGRSPKSLSRDLVKSLGYKEMPSEGWIPTMVPGAPAAWAELARRFGTKPLTELAKPAIQYGREGFPIPVNGEKLFAEGFQRIGHLCETDSIRFGEWGKLFTKNGQPYHAGELFRNPEFSDTLEEIAATNAESYYRGNLMKQITSHSQNTGGYFTEEDFRSYRPEWVTPIHTEYHGYEVFEMPPNGHGLTVLMALNILKGFDLPGAGSIPDLSLRYDAQTLHLLIEATKLAFTDAKHFVADPEHMSADLKTLLSEEYAVSRRGLIFDQALIPTPGNPYSGDTVYFCSADQEGNMVSFIQSNYKTFGSGIVIPGTGISLQCRGANFSLDPESDNCLEGGKRSYHTIIPGFLMKDGEPIGPFGVMGGFMQPQGHIQYLVNTIDYGMNPQDALDAPRYQWTKEKSIDVEVGIPEETIRKLKEMGHEITTVQDSYKMGRGQSIWRTENRILMGATEMRADGSISSY